MCNHGSIHSPNVPPEGPGEHLDCFFPAHYAAEHSESRYVTARALDYIRARCGGDQGWVLSLSYIKPHPPNINCEPYCSMYDPDDMPRATRRPEELDHAHPFIRAAIGGGDYKDERHLREFMACYYGMMRCVDDALGRLLDTLERLGLDEDTIVIFTSDHGDYLGDHWLGEKDLFHEPSIRIPLIIVEPEMPENLRGTSENRMTESVDIVPTLVETMGGSYASVSYTHLTLPTILLV